MTDNDDKNKRDRQPRSGDKPRGDRPRAFKPRGDKPFRAREDGDRKPFRPREDGDRPRDFKPRGDKPFRPREDGDRPRSFRPREDGDRKPFRPREDGDRPRSFRPREDGDRKPFRPREDGDRPRSFRPREDGDRKPFRPREDGDRPRSFRPREDGDRPRDFKPRGEKPFRPRDNGFENAYHDAPEANRIAKVMARAGLCSRRDAEGWIAEGRVSVNGTVIESPALDVTGDDVILVDGTPLPQRERTRLWLYHKPRGLVTTDRDPEGRPTVFDNLPADLPRVMSIGRLDINTEGLLLLTNDGGLARVLELPKTGWLRRYRVRVHGEVDQAQLDRLIEGTTIPDDEDGEITYGPIVARLERSKGTNSWLTMDLREGKNREIKRVLETLGLQVTRLIRVSFGPFQLGELSEGQATEIRSRYLRDQLGERLIDEAEADFESPVFGHGGDSAEEPARRAPPARGGRDRDRFDDEPEDEAPRRRVERKKPGEKRDLALSGSRPDLKVEREKVADRRGRTVKVERIVTTPSDALRQRYSREELSDPDRSFRGPARDDGDRPRAFKPRGDKPFRPREDGDRKPFRPREDGDRPRSFRPREDGDRPRSFRPREDGDRPRSLRPREDGDRKPFRPREDGGGKPPFKPRGGGKPGGGRPGGGSGADRRR